MEYASKYWNNLAERKLREGREEGREEGIEWGIQRERRDNLLRLITIKFGEISTKQAEKIQRADAAQLQTWTERLFTAKSTDVLLA